MTKVESPHVSNPLRYANKTLQMLKERIDNCNGSDFMAYVGLANRFIEDSYYEEQIDKKKD